MGGKVPSSKYVVLHKSEDVKSAPCSPRAGNVSADDLRCMIDSAVFALPPPITLIPSW